MSFAGDSSKYPKRVGGALVIAANGESSASLTRHTTLAHHLEGVTMHIRRMVPRPSPAMIVACAALIVALGGTSFATGAKSSVPRSSVGTPELIDGAVTLEKLNDNAVTSAKVRNFTLRAWDFKQGELPRGPRGPQGPPGPAGPQGLIGDLTLHATSVMVPGNAANGRYVTRVAEITCPSSERAISGGTRWSEDTDDRELITAYSRPVIVQGQPVGWRARGGSDVATDRIFTVQVLCAKA
jgi:hypothetical protein